MFVEATERTKIESIFLTKVMASPMSLPGGPIEICFSFDTTLSMTSYVDQVKARLQDMVQKLKSDIPGIKMALFAHGDYYQKRFKNKNPYVTRHIDFTDDVAELCTFIKDSTPTNGGDWDECYELVMKEAREQLTWSLSTNRVLVMIGDATPHELEDYGREFEGEKIDWKEEVKKLLESNIRCYGVYCETDRSGNRDKKFFKSLSELGNGSFLELKNFDSIFDFMMAICYREYGEDALFAYEAEVRGRSGGAAKDVHHMFTTLKKSVSNTSTEGLKKTVSVAKTKQQKPKEVLKKPMPLKKKRGKVVTVKDKKLAGCTKKPTKTNVKLSYASKEEAGPSQRTRQKSTVNKPVETSRKLAVHSKRAAQYKSKTPTLKRLRREKVPETNFGLRYFPWSSWKLVISNKAKDGLVPMFQTTGSKTKAVEYTAQTVFGGKTLCPALYEVAVRPSGYTKKVVYVKSTAGFKSYFWRSTLFASESLRKQVANVIRKQGGDILIRRLVLRKFPKYNDIPSTLKNYDYVWAPEDGDKKYRELKYDSYVVSEEMDVD